MKLSYRLATSEDTEELASFWSRNSGWDTIDATEWNHRFNGTPYGDALVTVATEEENNQIIGQFVFIPSRINVGGSEIKAYRPFAPILLQSLQSKFGIASLLTGKHPLLMLYRRAAKEVRRQGGALFYMLPDPRWSRVLKAFPFLMTQQFPLWCHPLPMAQRFELPEDITLEKLIPEDPRIESLWSKASLHYGPTVVRNRKSLAWRANQGDLAFYSVFRAGDLIGLCTASFKKNDHQWLLCDLLTTDADRSLEITLKALCNKIDEENSMLITKSDHERKIAILATPIISKALGGLGFVEDNYKFTLVLHVLDSDTEFKKMISPQHWYVSAND